MHHISSRLTVLLLFLISSRPLLAQVDANKASISGLVRDTSGVALREASVTARNLMTGAARETITDERGYYRFAA